MSELLHLDAVPVWAHGLIIVVVIGVIALGAHWTVESAAALAKRLGISELIIGLTVVAFGTSAPEFAVTVIAASRGQGDISVSNIVGSNIFNLGFILGGCAMIRAVPVSQTLVRRDGMLLGGTTLLLLALLGLDLRMGRADGALLFGVLLSYLTLLFWQRKRGTDEEADEADEIPDASDSLLRDGGLLLGGLVAMVGGSQILVESASIVARAMGVSDWVIGVTIVAAGTSAPEFATSLAAVLKGRYGISAGNVVGSDLFNMLGVLGLAGMLRPMEVDPMARISLAALAGMVLLVIVFMRTGWRVSRGEGLLLVLIAASRWVFDFTAHKPR